MPALDLPVADPAVQDLHNATACYTREVVVDDVFAHTRWPEAGGCLLDPGTGDGAFLEQAVARLPLAPDDVEGLAARVEGWEIHPGAVVMARARIAAHLGCRGWSPAAAAEGASRVVIEADFLAPGPAHRRYRVVVGNPPYAAYAFLPDVFKARYRDAVPAHARRDLLHAFLDRATEVLTDDGELAFVTADRWLFNEGAGELREAIGRRFEVETVVRLDAATTFYRAKTRRVGTPPRVHPVMVVLRSLGQGVRRLTREPIYPDGHVDVPDGAVPLGQLATVRLAPWMGTHGVFTLDARDAGHLPPEALLPCIDTDDIDPTTDTIRTPSRVAIRTVRGELPPPEVLAHLEATTPHLPRRARRNRGRANWWLPPEPLTHFPLAQEALLIPRIARGLRPIRLPAGIVPLNHNLTVVCATRAELEALEEVLTSDVAQRWIAQHAPRLESGFYSITTRLLRRLPIVLADRLPELGELAA